MSNDPNSMRSPLRQVRYLGSAKSGTHHAWHMRLTSMALLPLTIAFVWLMLTLVGKDYNAVRLALGTPVIAIVMLLFVLAGVYHMMLGMQTIIEDYVHGEPAKTVSLAANMFFSICIGLACVYAVLRLSFT
ncbi:MAG: succinate dehydrogenase, hydrophobic membrane anchor protein [Beijerinckiaceae bacterium]|jgi:succinate dehydrogenase / fumarate reductase, membrane anchor subunit|nr:succinate dehydrogenase, hydrophobic membrane anchor protein [Beijerinckiaceae bacterium]MDO9441528.1 succinate dehydrogenase, hydrophobic membrane anchor protein [Beijerinckiaceae bacterium]